MANNLYLVPLLTDLVNHTITSGIVPEILKFGQVTPMFKKNDPMDKANHRPVTLLPVHSKIHEKVFAEQLSEHFVNTYALFAKAMAAKLHF